MKYWGDFMDVLIRYGFSIEEITNMMDSNQEIERIDDKDIYENWCIEHKDVLDHMLAEMIERAKAMGANAIVGIDIDYETIGAQGSMLMVATSGTAVVL